MAVQDSLLQRLMDAQRFGYNQSTTGFLSYRIKEIPTPNGVALEVPITSGELYAHLQLLPPVGNVTGWQNGSTLQETQLYGYYKMALKQLENALCMPIVPKVYEVKCVLDDEKAQELILPLPFIKSFLQVRNGFTNQTLTSTPQYLITDEAVGIYFQGGPGVRMLVFQVVAGLGQGEPFPEDLRSVLLNITGFLHAHRGDVPMKEMGVTFGEVLARYQRYPDVESNTAFFTAGEFMIPAYSAYSN